MIHYDEMAWLLYLEGELDADRARQMTQHAQECDACRGLRDSLERESHLLSVALKEEEEAIPARILDAPGRRIPAWVWTLAFGSFFVVAYWVWTETVGPLLAQFTSAGFDRADLATVILFGETFWEGWPDMVDVMKFSALVIVAIAGIAVIRWRVRKSVSAIVLMTVLLALALPPAASAAEVRRGKSISVPGTETIHNDLIAAGQSVRIDGTVEGDVIAFTKDLRVTGHVTGDVISFTRDATIGGVVDGNVRVVGHDMILQGTVGKNVSAIGNSVESTAESLVRGGVISISARSDLGGKIDRDFLGIVGRTNLTGAIGGQMWLRGERLAVQSSAQIAGPAIFHGRRQPVVAAGARLASPIDVEITQQNKRSRRFFVLSAVRAIFSYGAALLVGILLAYLFPGFFRAALRETEAVGLPIGVGALALMVGFFILVFGIFLLFVGVAAALATALGYAPVMYVAQIFVGAWLGTKLRARRPDASQSSIAPQDMIARIALGLLVLHVLEFIPIFGILVRLLVLLWGTGAVLLAFYKMSRAELSVVAA
jgi:cytoskeletal protein CcmA (bactofilin family)